MRQFQLLRSNAPRAIAIAAAILVTVGVSGCHWFSKKDSAYQMSPESRPLEVPPDLDRPGTEGAMQVPDTGTQSVTRSEMSATSQAAASASGFTVGGERDDVFAKVGTALAGVDGLVIASKAQLLGTYDVSYQGDNFLVRVTKVDSGVYVSAVDPRGMPATSAAATQLIATLKSGLGGS
ncbi:hypothetical protein [Cognatiluteimonas profundi]|uniref:hypothetical protein n=1 Tax=Cognatiluteimonas profundi TaxID=2594501 RepID=UPI00131DE38B|nr:hypothetical protein [Lysobacter profundi]